MTALRQSAMMELEKIPEDKLLFVIQIMQNFYQDLQMRNFQILRIAYKWNVQRVAG